MLKERADLANQITLRSVYLAFGVAAFLLMYSAGASVAMSYSDAQAHVNQFLEETQNIDQTGIFLNNIRVAFGMFIPSFGAGLGGYSAFVTGMTFKALTIVNPAVGSMSPFMVLANPFGVLEVLAYGLAMSRSAMLTFQLVKERNLWRQFVLHAIIEIGIVVIALLIAAIIEGLVIGSA